MTETKLTCLDRIFFWSWLCDTADENRPLGKLSWCTSCGWDLVSDMLTFEVYTMIGIGGWDATGSGKNLNLQICING